MLLSFSACYTVFPTRGEGTRMLVDPSEYVVNKGSCFTVTFTVTNAADLFLWEIAVKYNASIVNCSAAWIPQDNVFTGRSVAGVEPVLNRPTTDGANCVLFGLTLFSGSVTVSNGVLCKMNFTALSEGHTDLVIGTSANPIETPSASWFSYMLDSELNQITFTEQNGSVMVSLGLGVSILSPENVTYSSSSSLPLTFTVSSPASWMGYCLDGTANVTVGGNTTLTALSRGSHSVVVYAADTLGIMGISQLVFFTVLVNSITINVSQTWDGDFVVNALDIVTIENCDFTVKNGMLSVYGTLYIENSTISIHDSYRKFKQIAVVDGNFTILRSTILGDNVIGARGNSRIRIIDSWSPTTSCWVYDESTEVTVESSNTRYFSVLHGSLSMTNSSCDWVILRFWMGSRFLSQNSSIDSIHLDPQQSSGELEFKSGLIEELRIHGQSGGGNCTLINSWVEDWVVNVIWFGGTIQNSQISILKFTLDPTWSGNLTLTPAHIEYLNLSFASSPMTIRNSTVEEFYVTVDGDHYVELSDSENVSLQIDASENLELVLRDSCISEVAFDNTLNCNLRAINTTINSVFFMEADALDQLEEGFHENFTLHFPEKGFSMTLTNSSVNHWSVYSCSAVSNSTLLDESQGYSLTVGAIGVSCFVQDSRLGSVYCIFQGHLTLTNCSVNTLYVYGDSEVTAINSTIGMIITDPVQITLVNSTVLLETDFSFEMDAEDDIELSYSEQCNPSLPYARFGDYMNITMAYDAYFEAQIKISYNETQVEESGVDESWLQMYYLNMSNVWQSCTIQGVDTANNYVWANVTHFYCFVIGSSTPHDVAVENLLGSKTVIGQGLCSRLNVTLGNHGAFSEVFNVTAYANGTCIFRFENVPVDSGEVVAVSFPWNTSGFGVGDYLVRVCVEPVGNETNIQDNNFTLGFINISIVGDINGDGKVDMKDVGPAARGFMTTLGMPFYNQNADVTDNDKIDMRDIALVARHFGDHYP